MNWLSLAWRKILLAVALVPFLSACGILDQFKQAIDGGPGVVPISLSGDVAGVYKASAIGILSWEMRRGQPRIVSVEMSTDGGRSFFSVIPILENTGSVTVRLPEVNSDFVIVRVVDGAAVYAQSSFLRIDGQGPVLRDPLDNEITEVDKVLFYQFSSYELPMWRLELENLVTDPNDFRASIRVNASQRGGQVSCLEKFCYYRPPITDLNDDSFAIYLTDNLGNETGPVVVHVNPNEPSSSAGLGNGAGVIPPELEVPVSDFTGSPSEWVAPIEGPSFPALYTPSSGPLASGTTVLVSSATELYSALAAATAGQHIVIADGTYFLPARITLTQSGTDSQRIFVSAQNPGAVRLQFCPSSSASAGRTLFDISGSYWVFEDLQVEGRISGCANGGIAKSHAFLFKGRANFNILRRNQIFNFQTPVRTTLGFVGVDRYWPEALQLYNNKIFNEEPLRGDGPFAGVSIQGGDGSVLRDNLIYDLVADSFNASFPAIDLDKSVRYALVENNIIACRRNIDANSSPQGIKAGKTNNNDTSCRGTPDCATYGNIYRNNIILNCNRHTSSHGIGIYNEGNSVYAHNLVFNSYRVFLSNRQNAMFSNSLQNRFIANISASFYEGSDLANLIFTQNVSATSLMWTSFLGGDLSLGAEASLFTNLATRSAYAPHDFCGNLRRTTTDIGPIDYGHPDAVACLSYLQSRFNEMLP